jgi:hypothetical protein
MKIQFDAQQQYELNAVAAVVDLFDMYQMSIGLS